jgi:hypothetical protein
MRGGSKTDNSRRAESLRAGFPFLGTDFSMTQITTLQHITFQTGQARATQRSEVDPVFLKQLAKMVRDCDRAGSVEAPTPSGLMVLNKIGLPGESRDVACWSLKRPDDAPLMTQALALKKEQGDALWRELHGSLGQIEPKFVTPANRPPTEPWLGVALHLPLLLWEGEWKPLEWLGDFERCVAWAWIDGVYAVDGR